MVDHSNNCLLFIFMGNFLILFLFVNVQFLIFIFTEHLYSHADIVHHCRNEHRVESDALLHFAIIFGDLLKTLCLCSQNLFVIHFGCNIASRYSDFTP